MLSSNVLAKKAAIIIDFDTKETLFEINADTLNFPASLAKIMTLYITFDYLNKKKIFWDTEMKVSKIAASRSCSCIDIKNGDKILEIGCGWGGFSEFLGKNYDCDITAITISKEQFYFAKKRIKDANLSKKVTV